MPGILEPPATAPPKAATAPEAARPAEATPLRWVAWPLRDRLAQLWWVPVGVAALATVVAVQFGSLLCGVGAAAAVWLTLARLWLPVAYSVGADGLTITRLGQSQVIAWSHVRAYRRTDAGLMLFVRPVQGRLRPRPIAAVGVSLPDDDKLIAEALSRILASAREIAA